MTTFRRLQAGFSERTLPLKLSPEGLERKVIDSWPE